MGIGAFDFDHVCQHLRRETGIVLEAGKEYLVEARMMSLAQREGLGSIDNLLVALRAPDSTGLQRKLLDAMTTNETLFFRDIEPFELLRKTIVPELIQQRQASRRLSIWCAASSTGQEPYSLMMMLRDSFPALEDGWRIDVLATDYSRDVLEKARAGRYGQLEVNRGLPARMLVKYFTKVGTEWQIADSIRSAVRYEEINLNASWPAIPPCDIVLLRNVMIYFDVEAKRSILARIRRLLAPDGYLFLGAAETTLGLDDAFERVPAARAGCYRLVGQAVKGRVS